MICFAWSGFPQYAARCVGAFVKSTDEKVIVVATRPSVPVKGMDELCGCMVEWIDFDEIRSLEMIFGEWPRACVVSGWGIGVFNRFSDEVRANGGKVIAMCDNNWAGLSIRELLKSVRFRIKLRSKFDSFFVPGKSGIKLLKFYGVDESKIAKGMYSADASLFTNGKPLAEREKKIIYVGRFVAYKNALRMVRAFADAIESVKDGWTLELYGCGPLQDELEALVAEVNDRVATYGAKVFVHNFLQPDALAAKYRESRIFCLPSISEHWGLVVHEAALSGCVLMLGRNVGAADDMLGQSNGFAFDPCSVKAIAESFRKAMTMSDEELEAAQKESLELASGTSLEKFVASVGKLISL